MRMLPGSDDTCELLSREKQQQARSSSLERSPLRVSHIHTTDDKCVPQRQQQEDTDMSSQSESEQAEPQTNKGARRVTLTRGVHARRGSLAHALAALPSAAPVASTSAPVLFSPPPPLSPAPALLSSSTPRNEESDEEEASPQTPAEELQPHQPPQGIANGSRSQQKKKPTLTPLVIHNSAIAAVKRAHSTPPQQASPPAPPPSYFSMSPPAGSMTPKQAVTAKPPPIEIGLGIVAPTSLPLSTDDSEHEREGDDEEDDALSVAGSDVSAFSDTSAVAAEIVTARRHSRDVGVPFNAGAGLPPPSMLPAGSPPPAALSSMYLRPRAVRLGADSFYGNPDSQHQRRARVRTSSSSSASSSLPSPARPALSSSSGTSSSDLLSPPSRSHSAAGDDPPEVVISDTDEQPPDSPLRHRAPPASSPKPTSPTRSNGKSLQGSTQPAHRPVQHVTRTRTGPLISSSSVLVLSRLVTRLVVRALILALARLGFTTTSQRRGRRSANNDDDGDGDGDGGSGALTNACFTRMLALARWIAAFQAVLVAVVCASALGVGGGVEGNSEAHGSILAQAKRALREGSATGFSAAQSEPNPSAKARSRSKRAASQQQWRTI